MQLLANKKIVLGVCGGIAAYKSAYLVRELVKAGAEVRVVMTAAAHAFMTPMVFQALSGHSVREGLLDPEAERAMGHIELARWADVVLIAPASANILAKMAQGIADDLLSTLYLVAECPVWVCPAMNRSMWAHVATQTNVRRLRRRHVKIIGPDHGSQACGEVGEGRMSDVSSILRALCLQDVYGRLRGRQVVVTAGPTLEAIDPVRYISNHSSGKMGYALAEAAQCAGATVTLITGPTALTPPAGVTVCQVRSAQEMFEAVMQTLSHQTVDLFIASAAVADYAVQAPAVEKIKKQADTPTLTLTLHRNPDILASVASRKLARWIVGFSAETTNMMQHAHQKMHAKGVDMMIANEVGDGKGFHQDEHECVVITSTTTHAFPRMPKIKLAGQLLLLMHQALG